jgi:UDP-glucose 4-epimerase
MSQRAREGGQKSSKVLVTGGAGFIGSHLVEALLADGHAVVVVDDLSNGSMENLPIVGAAVTLHQGDVRDVSVLRRALQGVELVFHLAANSSVPLSVDQPTIDFEVNALGTQRLLLGGLEAGVKRIVLVSSAAVYGLVERTPTKETDPLKPVSPYGASKLAAEALALAYRQVYGLDVVICRIFNTFGPRQRRYVMHDFLTKLARTPNELRVRGDGTQVRDYCYVSDTVKALRLVAGRGEGTYNIAGGRAISIREVAEAIVGVVAPGARIVYGDTTWKGDVPTLHADISRLRGLGFEPEVDLVSGLHALIQERRIPICESST